MTTDAQAADHERVPRWFMDFVRENARQHAELADRINGVRTESGEQFAGLGAQIAELRGEFRELRGEFRSLKTVGIVIASSGAVLTAAAVTAVARYVLGG